jgi:Na+/proline symporter
MRTVDLLIVAAFLIYIVWDGVRRGRDSKDAEGYMLAGRRMRWWAMGLSVMATQASAITLISTTGQGFDQGMRFLHFYLAIPFAMVVLCATVVPWFHRARVFTAYEYLERRFDRPTRLLASVLFLVSRSLAVGTVMYAPSIVLSRGVGIPAWETIAVMGVASTIYTAIGGNTAVIVTDAKQMLVMMAGWSRASSSRGPRCPTTSGSAARSRSPGRRTASTRSTGRPASPTRSPTSSTWCRGCSAASSSSSATSGPTRNRCSATSPARR